MRTNHSNFYEPSESVLLASPWRNRGPLIQKVDKWASVEFCRVIPNKNVNFLYSGLVELQQILETL